MKKLAMGIDIGGTNTAFGLVDEDGTIFSESAISTEKYKKFDDYEAYIKALCESMHALIGSVSFDFELIGIGIGAPNANYHTGMIEAPANLWKFRDDEPNPDESRRMFHFVDDIKASFPGVDVAITNDANAAAIGEMVFGNAKGMKDFVVITSARVWARASSATASSFTDMTVSPASTDTSPSTAAHTDASAAAAAAAASRHTPRLPASSVRHSSSWPRCRATATCATPPTRSSRP